MTGEQSVPHIRIQNCNAAPIRADGDYVLYWMIAFRRLTSNFSLQRAVELAVEFRKPLVIFEPLRIGYRWASDRIHRFVIDGMVENSACTAALKNPGVLYFPYVEPKAGAGKGLLLALAERACIVVTDEFPSSFLPRMVSAAASQLSLRLEAVDSNGLLPLRATDRVFTTAFSFRAFLQKQLPPHLKDFPKSDPLHGVHLAPIESLPKDIMKRWPAVSKKLLAGDTAELSALPIDHSVGAVKSRGGSTVARTRLKSFLDQHLTQYAAGANDPDADNRSGLSPYLHFGHISPHELFRELMSREEWSLASLGEKTGGKREGWWGASPGAESWLDEFITWRELGYNMSWQRDDYDHFESLPNWAKATLEKHERDPRQTIYSLSELDTASTHDPLWNAAQTQLVREGRMHNYLRMLWGKKILEWTETPRDALNVLIELNNKYALDGRNPNSYSGIFWTLGRYDRPWGPERPIFGTIRYMSSDNTRKKVDVRKYLKTYSSVPTTL
ncbi:MAG: deoxyribodipyrimidine photolyase [Pirellula sp.]